MGVTFAVTPHHFRVLTHGVCIAVPSWFAIGWTSRDRTLFLSPEEAEERSILADFLQDAYYGQWYHNAGIIVFAVLSSHFITLFGGGYGWLILIMAVCATYYETSVKRVRRNARDDLAREVAKKGLKTDVESAAWINSFSEAMLGDVPRLGRLLKIFCARSATFLADLRAGAVCDDRELSRLPTGLTGS